MKLYKGHVMNIENQIAHIFTEDGNIVRLHRHDGMRIGQTLMFTDQDVIQSPVRQSSDLLSRFRRWGIVVPAMLFFIAFGSYQYAMAQVYAVISVDINPSLSLSLDRNGNVIKVETHNEDAEDLLATIDSLKGMSASDAVSVLIKASDGKYISIENDDVYVSAAVLKEGMKKDSETLLSEILDKTTQDVYEEDVVVYTATLEANDYEASQAEGISMSTYVLAKDEVKKGQGLVDADASTPDEEDAATDEANSDSKTDLETKQQPQPQANENAISNANPNARFFRMTIIDNPEVDNLDALQEAQQHGNSKKYMNVTDGGSETLDQDETDVTSEGKNQNQQSLGDDEETPSSNGISNQKPMNKSNNENVTSSPTDSETEARDDESIDDETDEDQKPENGKGQGSSSDRNSQGEGYASGDGTENQTDAVTSPTIDEDSTSTDDQSNSNNGNPNSNGNSNTGNSGSNSNSNANGNKNKP